MLLMEIKRKYTKPSIKRIELDNSISLIMMTDIPGNPDPRGDSKSNPKSDPFESPFGDKPFN